MTLAGARQAGASQQEIEEVAAVAMAVSAFKTNSLFASKFPAE
jgi:alkylhydroperoxidase/carboxymuconolactone decarboxylase family protein YurZ